MKKITDSEENEMYRLLSESLFSFCESKPKNSIEYLAKQMLEFAHEDPNTITTFTNKKEIKETGYELTDQQVKRTKKQFKDQYKIIKKLGYGSQGDVYLAEEKVNPENKRAVKIIKKKLDNSNELCDSNISLLTSLDHPHVVKIYDVINEKDNLFIIQEYIEQGDLYMYLKKNHNKLNEKMTKMIINQLLLALIFLHDNKIIHRDIKPENILVAKSDPELVLKLNDFATSSFYVKHRELNELTGAPMFTSPEMLSSNYNEKSDIWSLGILTFLLLSGKSPFLGHSFEIFFQILHKEIEYLQSHTPESKKFISKLLNRNVDVRPTAKEALDDDWLRSELNENVNEEVFVKSLENMIEFLNTNNLRKTIFSYILSRKIYDDDNIELMKLFEKTDKDKNGYIDENELFEQYGKYFPGTVEQEWEMIKTLMKSVDLNKSGKMSYSEFLIVSNKINKSMNMERMKEIFNFFDFNHNNYIEAEDLKRVFGDTSLQIVKYQVMIQEFDKNGDKKLSFQEFIDMITKYF